MFKAVVLFVCSLLIGGTNGGSYLITAPQTIQRDSYYFITVDILNATDVTVVATLQDVVFRDTGTSDVNKIRNATGVFSAGTTGNLSIPIEEDLICNNCQLHVRGTGGLQFEQTLQVSVNSKTVVILIQTDKAIYKAGQTVQFRLFAVFPDLLLYKGAFNYEIADPNGNKISVVVNATNESHVVEGSLDLSGDPVFGTWSITVSLVDVIETYTQTFEVSQYELPTFEITVELPPYALIKDELLKGTVKAQYTFGQPVKGTVELHVGPNQGPNFCGDLPQSVQIGFSINGNQSFTVPREDIERVVPLFDRQEVKVIAYVTDESTGVRLNGSAVVKFYTNKYQIKFTDNTPGVFKAGLQYTAFIQVTTPDNKPPTESNITVSLYTSVTYQLTVPDQALYSIQQFTGTYGLPGKNVTLPTSGLITFDIDIPTNATSITIKATQADIQTTKTVEKMYSQSNNYIQLTLLNKDVKAGTNVSIRLDGTEPLHKVNYLILARGSVAHSGVIDGEGERSIILSVDIVPEYAPVAHLLVYYTRGNDEVVGDSFAFLVDGIYNNNVSIAFNQSQAEPNTNVSLIVTASPGSNVFVLAVDQSVLLLKTGNDITTEKVTSGISDLDVGAKPTDKDFALSYSAKSMQEVFSKIGIAVITDVSLSVPRSPVAYDWDMPHGPSPRMTAMYAYEEVQDYSYKMPEGLSSSQHLQEVGHVRKLFPEVFFWSTHDSDANGTASIQAVVPDTITSWIASAFATHPSDGLGVAATTKLTVFKSFFVSLTMPSAVIRGEQVVVQAVVFNYLPTNQAVTVTLKASTSFQSIRPGKGDLIVLESGAQVRQIQVVSQQQGVVYFPILATTVGEIQIDVSAQTTIAADEISRPITVRYEGAPVNFNYPEFVNLDNMTRVLSKDYEFPLPDSVVNGSDSASIRVTGDLIGSSITSFTSLLQLPTGCGEQSMVSISHDVFVGQYLQSIGQLTPALEAQISAFLQAGYQRQLTYQRSDGGFSAFGNSDDSSSTWLTAYVCRVLYDAGKFIYRDPRVLIKGIDWLAERQNRDGSFNEFGRVLDSRTQGAGTGPSLTAFVLLAFLKNEPLSRTDCTDNTQPCYRAAQWANVTALAIKNLEGLVDSDSIRDQFSMSLVSYALTLSNSSKANVIFKKLTDLAQEKGGLLFWQANSTVNQAQGSEFLIWRPPFSQTIPVNILITSYAILTYTAMNRLATAAPAVRWLTTQRNSFGGFASSQDTSVGLEALAAYAAKSIKESTNLTITVTNNKAALANFNVNKANALVQQIRQLNDAPPRVHLEVTGEGFALVEFVTSFYVSRPLSTPSFDVSTVLLDDNLDSFNLMICTKWLWNRETGMVVQEISIPSGFAPDLTSLGNIIGLKRSERRGNSVNIYFDKVGKTSVCYSIRMTRTDKIANIQKNYIVTWDYYNPRDQTTTFWQPRALQKSTVCDVCPQCCL